MSSFIDDRGPDRLADDLAVMFAQASDPRRDQHASQGGSLPLVDLALAVSLSSSRLDATLVEVECDAAQRLTSQDSADSLAAGVGLGRFQLLANDATLTLGPFAQFGIDDLVAERPRPATGPLARTGVAHDCVLDALASDRRLVPRSTGLHEAIEAPARCGQIQLAPGMQADLDLGLAAHLHKPREVVWVARESIMVSGDKHVRLPTGEELDHSSKSGLSSPV
jgi:hypothetical protein